MKSNRKNQRKKGVDLSKYNKIAKTIVILTITKINNQYNFPQVHSPNLNNNSRRRKSRNNRNIIKNNFYYKILKNKNKKNKNKKNKNMNNIIKKNKN